MPQTEPQSPSLKDRNNRKKAAKLAAFLSDFEKQCGFPEGYSTYDYLTTLPWSEQHQLNDRAAKLSPAQIRLLCEISERGDLDGHPIFDTGGTYYARGEMVKQLDAERKPAESLLTNEKIKAAITYAVQQEKARNYEEVAGQLPWQKAEWGTYYVDPMTLNGTQQEVLKQLRLRPVEDVAARSEDYDLVPSLTGCLYVVRGQDLKRAIEKTLGVESPTTQAVAAR